MTELLPILIAFLLSTALTLFVYADVLSYSCRTITGFAKSDTRMIKALHERLEVLEKEAGDECDPIPEAVTPGAQEHTQCWNRILDIYHVRAKYTGDGDSLDGPSIIRSALTAHAEVTAEMREELDCLRKNGPTLTKTDEQGRSETFPMHTLIGLLELDISTLRAQLAETEDQLVEAAQLTIDQEKLLDVLAAPLTERDDCDPGDGTPRGCGGVCRACMRLVIETQAEELAERDVWSQDGLDIATLQAEITLLRAQLAERDAVLGQARSTIEMLMHAYRNDNRPNTMMVDSALAALRALEGEGTPEEGCAVCDNTVHTDACPADCHCRVEPTPKPCGKCGGSGRIQFRQHEHLIEHRARGGGVTNTSFRPCAGCADCTTPCPACTKEPTP